MLDEPTSQLDPVAGDELIGLLRRLNEDSDAAILLAEHRLERCLGAADRVIALVDGRIVCDAPPERVPRVGRERRARARDAGGAAARRASGCRPRPGVKAARAALRERGLLPDPSPRMPPVERQASRPRPRWRRRGGREPDAALRFDRVWHELPRRPGDPARRLADASAPASGSR